MDKAFQRFYRDFYKKSAGFIPAKPINQNIYPGDFFQIKDSEIILLGNIFRNNLIRPEDCHIDRPKPLSNFGWSFSHGVTKPYSGRGNGESMFEGKFEFSKQILAFEGFGSYFFKADGPETVRISNWNDLRNELIIKLTQTHFSFRELYVVTESATMDAWTLAICGSQKGELEIATDAENFGLLDLFGHGSSKTIQSKEIEYYHREHKRKPNFFKAKKLVVREDRLDIFISDLINQRESVYEWANSFYDYNFEFDTKNHTHQISENAKSYVLDMLSTGDLNPNTALQYFRWADANLDDVDRLFLSFEGLYV